MRKTAAPEGEAADLLRVSGLERANLLGLRALGALADLKLAVLHRLVERAQYTSTDLRRLLAVHQMDGSIGTVGDAYDNGLMESTIGLYKSELIDFEAGTWTDWGEVERATAGWVHWYNHERLHSSLGHIPPIEHYTNYQRENYAGLHAA